MLLHRKDKECIMRTSVFIKLYFISLYWSSYGNKAMANAAIFIIELWVVLLLCEYICIYSFGWPMPSTKQKLCVMFSFIWAYNSWPQIAWELSFICVAEFKCDIRCLLKRGWTFRNTIFFYTWITCSSLWVTFVHVERKETCRLWNSSLFFFSCWYFPNT